MQASKTKENILKKCRSLLSWWSLLFSFFRNSRTVDTENDTHWPVSGLCALVFTIRQTLSFSLSLSLVLSSSLPLSLSFSGARESRPRWKIKLYKIYIIDWFNSIRVMMIPRWDTSCTYKSYVWRYRIFFLKTFRSGSPITCLHCPYTVTYIT